jgi:NAD+ kinase
VKIKAILAVKDSLSDTEVENIIARLSEHFVLYSLRELPYTIKVDSYKVIEDEGISTAITIGGDGTLLGLSRFLPEHVEVIGINMGGRGVLAQIDKDSLNEFIEGYLSKKYIIEKRLRLRARISDVETVNVLNEFYIQRANFNQTPYFDVRAEGIFELRERMDGLIISTPSGSTGYNFSNGGPIVDQELETIIINPVLPLRPLPPIIVRPKEIHVVSNLHTYVIADGQLRYEVMPNERIEIFKGEYLSLVRLRSSSSQIQKMLNL